MKVNMIKINNFKSLGEENNILTMDDINILVGKNESGKSNIIEALSGLDLTGINDKNYFDKKNKMNLSSTISISLELSPYDYELKEKKNLTKMNIEIFSNYDITYEGGFSECISKDKEFINSRKKIFDIIDTNTITWSDKTNENSFNILITMIKNAENSIFINYTFIDSIIDRIAGSQYEFKEELANCLKICKKRLLFYNRYLPYFLFVNDSELKNFYSKDEIDKTGSSEVEMFYELLEVSDIDLDELISYWDTEDKAIKRQLKENVNKKLKRNLVDGFNSFYTQEKLNVELDLDDSGVNLLFDTSGTYMNYDERSQGLRWFFNTYIKIKANNIYSDNVVYLMDEPGNKLHVNAQKELIKLFKNLVSYNNQMVFTTHSPYMLDLDNFNSIRLISKNDNGYTNITNKFHSLPNSDKTKIDTLTPIYDAMGFDYKYNFGPSTNKLNVIVEGPSDYNYISAYFFQKQLSEGKKPYIIPSTGVNNINRIVSILIGWGCNYVVILDNDKQGREEYNKLVSKLDVNTNLIFFTDATHIIDKNQNHTIEKLFNKSDYDNFICQPDYENFKTLYSKQLLNSVLNNDTVYSKETMDNFDKLFNNIL